MFKIVEGPIDDLALEDEVRTDADGAVIVFRGVARRHSRGRDVVHLEYEAYPEMAEKVMAQIGDEMQGALADQPRGDRPPHGRARDRPGVGGDRRRPRRIAARPSRPPSTPSIV